MPKQDSNHCSFCEQKINKGEYAFSSTHDESIYICRKCLSAAEQLIAHTSEQVVNIKSAKRK